MRKTDKKIDNQIRVVLTEVCDKALEEVLGFQWLTHLVNYENFPKSLKVICIFDTNKNLNDFLANKKSKNLLIKAIEQHLQKVSVKMKNMTDHLSFDTEEKCETEHQGNWAKRLQ